MSGLMESRWAPSSATGADSSSSNIQRPKPKPKPTPSSSRAPAPASSHPGNDQSRIQGGQGIVFTSTRPSTNPGPSTRAPTPPSSHQGKSHGQSQTGQGIVFPSASTGTNPGPSTRPSASPSPFQDNTQGPSQIGLGIAFSNASPSPKSEPPSISAQELSRFTKITSRLRWKLPFLEEGYRLATQPAPKPEPDLIDLGIDPEPVPDPTFAETMFKIDFHEYYALLERAIVHLLSVFGVTVSSAPARKWRGKQAGQAVAWNGGPGGPGASAGHSYHANVLETLEDPECPLHEVLGCGSVYEQLRKAKELRNRWKRADMSAEEEEREGWSRKPVLPLESYDFDQILTEIFGGLEEGFLLAQTHVGKVDGDGAGGRDVEMMDGGWDFIVEAMDWHAV